MNPARLAQFVPGTTVATYYTVPNGRYTVVKNIVIANTSGAAIPFTLSLVPVGSVADNSNRIVPGTSIPALGTVALDLTQVMHGNDFIAAFAGTAGVLAVTISGMES